MFIPIESCLAEVLDEDLLNYASSLGVMLASPTTLLAMLKAVSYVLGRKRVADNAEEAASLALEMNDRLKVFKGHMEGARKAVEGAREKVEDMEKSYEKRIAPNRKKARGLLRKVRQGEPRNRDFQSRLSLS